ncbi:hypothetical protein ASG40_14115 [Methylobacterium sp. Leaf399]|uniref:EF-hand domain-containing protein n=1 Tax=Methylobacterium sp. Leaf399 TaxID=1736364 RepID=UPI0006F278FF|nr:EF-hand domain-containing protein [Methylobacterium sp. Leaf399]KQT07534.1 hypothetical protein ASG40_14115 [Methylobacterium sp. Leaf399]
MSSHLRHALLFSAILVALPMGQALAAPAGKMAVEMFDPDKDGTVDLKEAQAAAAALFDSLDPDKDGTLDKKELKGRLTAKELKAADPDMDGTLDKNEYLAIVAKRFSKADPDGDGTLDAKEFGKPAGKAVLKLMK